MPRTKASANPSLCFPEAATMKEIGIKTLRRMRSVKTYNDWCFKVVQPYVGRRVVEVGCGIGNMTQYFTGQDRLVCLDILPEAVDLVRSQLEAWPNVQVVLGDIVDDGLVQELGPGSFDTCVSFNVLEHILDDNRAMSNMARLLKPGGYVATIVPGCARLYGTLDVNLGHYRRYEPPLLRALLDAARLEVVEIRWMNLPGMLGWFLSSRVFRRSVLPKTALGAFNVLAPLFRKAEALVPVPIGQSLVCVGRKP